MARVEIKGLAVGTAQDTRGNVVADVSFTCSGTVFAASTGATTLSGVQLRSDAAGQFPGWLDPGVYTIAVPSQSTTVTFEVGGGASGTPAASAVTFSAVSSLSATNVQAAIAELNADVEVVKEAPLNLQDARYGATNGANIDSALTTALSHLGSGGGQIMLGPGSFTISSPPSFKETRSVSILGLGGGTAGAAPATVVTYTGTGTRAIDARSSFGFSMRDLMLVYNQAGFTGTLVDLSHSIAQDAAYAVFERVYVGGSGVRAASRLFDLDKAIIVKFRDSILAGAADAVRGMSAAGSYSNVIVFDNCIFKGQTSQHCRNAAETWVFLGCTFENLVTSGGVAAGAGALVFDASVVSEGVVFVGCWFGDATTAGDWINFNGQGLTVVGCHIGAGDVGIRLSQNNTIGVTIKGNVFDGQNTAGMVISGTGHRGYDIGPSNVMIAGSAPVIAFGGTFPVGSRIQDPSNVGGAYVFSSETPVFTTTVNDAAFPFVPVDGMGPMLENIAGVRKVCYRIGGTWYKATLT